MRETAEQHVPARAVCKQPVRKGTWLAALQRAVSMPSPVRLVCFPYAGGGPGVYRSWPALLPKEIEILCAHLPGREACIADVPQTDFESVSGELVRAVCELPVTPTLFFGHSLGGLLAYEVAFRLARAASPHAPVRLILSGCAPPQVKKGKDEGPGWLLSEEQFIEKLRELNGTPEEVLTSREFLDLFLPMLRADFRLAYNARQALRSGLSVDTHVLGGAEDAEAAQDDLEQWREYLAKDPKVTIFRGGHMFLNEDPQAVCNVVAKHLRELGDVWMRAHRGSRTRAS